MADLVPADPQQLSSYDYHLPEELIARHPLPQREGARMLVLDRQTQTIEHRTFRDFTGYLRAGDLVVLNDTRVVPARFFSDDRRIEFLFLEALSAAAPGAAEVLWKCLVKPGRKMRLGARVVVQGIAGEVTGICPEGERIIRFSREIDLEQAGELPLPPYFERAVEPADAERYQTVFARARGAVAAPTAGLHFTPEILASIPHTFLTLHVGLGTFRGVLEDDLAKHRMHAERYVVGEKTATQVNAAQRRIAIGTTTTRVLESLGRPLQAGSGSTDIFIRPPYRFQTVDALLTNFHLPRSTLLMLISAFAGLDFVRAAYAEAIRERYRFYSYGDCMLIL